MANNEADLLATSRGRLSATLGPYTPKLKEDFNMPIKATCHCGATQFEVSETPTSVTECNCTFCFKRGVLWAYYSPEQVRFVKNDRTTVYTTDESTHKHHHCSVCGCGAYNEMRCSWGENGPDFTRPQIAVNVKLFDDFDLAAIPVKRLDGRNLW
jgi:hypothetical protein